MQMTGLGWTKAFSNNKILIQSGYIPESLTVISYRKWNGERGTSVVYVSAIVCDEAYYQSWLCIMYMLIKMQDQNPGNALRQGNFSQIVVLAGVPPLS